MKKSILLKVTAAVTAAVMVLSSVTVYALGRVPTVRINRRLYTGDVIMVGNSAYVSLREFTEAVNGGEIKWDSETKTATVIGNEAVTSARIGEKYLTTGRRSVACPSGILLKNDKTVVPLRAVADIFGYSTQWDSESFSASIEVAEKTDLPYSEEDLYWLSRIIHAEAGGECFEGKLAVGAVVMNRVACPDFPSTVYGVIFDTARGVQFSPVLNGSVYLSPDRESVAAAQICLEGKSGLDSSILFFLNPEKAESKWITEARAYVVSIGNHDFYA